MTNRKQDLAEEIERCKTDPLYFAEHYGFVKDENGQLKPIEIPEWMKTVHFWNEVTFRAMLRLHERTLSPIRPNPNG